MEQIDSLTELPFWDGVQEGTDCFLLMYPQTFLVICVVENCGSASRKAENAVMFYVSAKL